MIIPSEQGRETPTVVDSPIAPTILTSQAFIHVFWRAIC